MGPLRPARPKRKKAAALTAPKTGSSTTNALPIVLLLLLLPTGAKCAQRTQTTCGHTSPHTPRSGVVKRFLASKTFTEKLHANHTANEPATLPASSEPVKAFTDRSHAHYPYGSSTHRLRQQNNSQSAQPLLHVCGCGSSPARSTTPTPGHSSRSFPVRHVSCQHAASPPRWRTEASAAQNTKLRGCRASEAEELPPSTPAKILL